MKHFFITFSLKDTREGYSRISDNQDLEPATAQSAWRNSNEWISVGFDLSDEDDNEMFDNTFYELRNTLRGLEYELEVKDDNEL